MTAWLVIIFAAGYLLIACEHRIQVNKAAVPLLITKFEPQSRVSPHSEKLPMRRTITTAIKS